MTFKPMTLELAIVYDRDMFTGQSNWHVMQLERETQPNGYLAPMGHIAGPGMGGFKNRNEALLAAISQSPKSSGGFDHDFTAAVETLAETPLTSETPGVHGDQLVDQLIMLARTLHIRETVKT